jgi:hypothetical protein
MCLLMKIVPYKEDNSCANIAIARRYVFNVLGKIKKTRQTRTKAKHMKVIGWSSKHLREFVEAM